MKSRLIICMLCLVWPLSSYGESAGISSENRSKSSIDVLMLSLPGLTWALEIRAPGFSVKEREETPDGAGARLLAVSQDTDFVLSAFIEQAPKPGAARECREYFWDAERAKTFQPRAVKTWELGDMALVEYLLDVDVPQLRATVKHLHAYLAEDGMWIDVHVSKVHFTDEDDVVFKDIVNAIHIQKHRSPDISELFGLGSVNYLQRNYGQAIKYYQQALEIERANPTLPKNHWRVLVDNLGMSYGLSGNPKKAKDTFEYGLTHDPEYPMFFYNLACAAAEMNNMDEATANLRKAYQYESNMIPGERMPDPATDTSFSHIRNDPKFRAVLEERRH